MRVHLPRWRNRHDHYYGITAFLAANGVQTLTCRLVAVFIFLLGIIPVLLIGSPIGPDSTGERIAAVTVAASCVVMAATWLRPRWPSRLQSAACVVVGTVCIAVGSLISDPAYGLLGTTTFAVLAGYITFFHTARLLAFTWTIAAVTVAILARQLAEIDTAMAVCSVMLVVMVNIFAAFACATVIRLVGSELFERDVEPITGLLNRDGFYRSAATLLASRSRGDDRHLVVAVINIDNFTLLTAMGGVAAGDRARVAIGQTLRETVRHDAVVAHLSDAEFLIADSFTAADPAPLLERVRSAITTTPLRLAGSIGAVSAPMEPLARHPPNDVLDELLAIATTAMYDVRRAGGNLVRCVIDPVLTVLADPEIDDP
jgi:diguanylate cyclase (GGDEF)-like protein